MIALRDPSVEPGTGCTDPSSTTNIKCVFWGGPVTTANAKNDGQYRSSFHVVIAGSNGYVNKTIAPASGYSSPSYFGTSAIDAPLDCNGLSTSLGTTLFSDGPFDARLCAAACDAKSAAAGLNTGKACKFFNTYLVSKNGVTIGQYCSLYSQTWSSTYATKSSSTSGNNKYTIAYSYGFSNAEDAGICKVASTSTYSSVQTSTIAAPTIVPTTRSGGFLNWTTFKANGANLGAWLEKEKTHDPIWWESVGGSSAPDEWTLCQILGSKCGPIFEARYASFLNTSTIDILAKVGVNTLR